MISPQESKPRTRSCLSLPTRIDYIKPIQSYVEALCHIHGCDKRDSLMVVLAVEEAVSNVIHHGYEFNQEEVFEICFDVGAADLTIEINEKGIPFDPDKIEFSGDSESQVSPDPSHGFGIRLMKGAMDRVEFLNLGKKGKLVRMSKYFSHGKIDKYLSKENLLRDTPLDQDTIQPPFAVRALLADETIEVSRCAYRAYGYTYREFIYYPKKIWELNQTGQLHSFVLVDDRDKILGHAGISFSTPGATIAELTALFIDPVCRGRRLLGEISTVVMAEAEQMELQMLFVHAVTSHCASQKGATRCGFTPTGLLLAALFSDLEFKALTGKVAQKENALLMVKQLQDRPLFELWVPDRYSKIVESLAADIGRKISVKTDVVPLPKLSGGAGNCYYQVEEFNFVEIRIMTFGEDVLAELGHRLRGYITNKVDVVYLYIDVECPEAGTFTERCQDLGFFFCGYMPGEMTGRDALILQKLNNITIDFTALDLASKQAVQIMEFIQGDMPAIEPK